MHPRVASVAVEVKLFQREAGAAEFEKFIRGLQRDFRGENVRVRHRDPGRGDTLLCGGLMPALNQRRTAVEQGLGRLQPQLQVAGLLEHTGVLGCGGGADVVDPGREFWRTYFIVFSIVPRAMPASTAAWMNCETGPATFGRPKACQKRYELHGPARLRGPGEVARR